MKKDKIEILNKSTEIINYWQENGKKHSFSEVQAKFPEFIFSGNN